MKNFLVGLFVFALITGCEMKEKADLIIINATVYTVDTDFSVCSSLAVKDGLIMATGSDDEILNNYRSKQIIDLQGAPLYPGFNDAHCHILGLGLALNRVDIRGANSFEEVLTRLKERYDSHQPQYLEGDGWDQTLWEGGEFPDNSELSRMFPDIPVILFRVDYHAVIVNDAAIEALGITPGDKDIPQGEALVKNGKFTGVFLENTADRFKDVLPELNNKQLAETILTAQQECFRYGLTSLSSAGERPRTIDIMDSLYAKNELKIRSDVWLTPTDESLARFTEPFISERMQVSAVKLFIDGALGSRGALLLEPYSDMPSEYGLRVITAEEFERVCKWAADHGFRVATHCIGDAANREALLTYAKFIEPGNDLRWRIEHAQIIDPADLDLFGKYAIVPSIQPIHATSDMLWAVDRLGSRIANSYIFKDLLNQTGWLPSGTDFPVEGVNPVHTFFAAVYRQNLDFVPEGGFQMENALTKEEALRSMTIWAAKSSFEEDVKGSLEPGKYADFIVLDRDIITENPERVPDAKVVMTFVGGEKVFELKN